MRYYHAVQNKTIDNIDRRNLLVSLQKYYKTDDRVKIIKKLRSDLKNRKTIDKLLCHTSFEIRELLVHLNSIFDGLFNKKLIKRLRSELNPYENIS